MKFVCALGLSLSCIAGLAGPVLGSGLAVGQPQAVHGGDGGDGGVDWGQVFVDAPKYREVELRVDSGNLQVSMSSDKMRARAMQVPIWSQVFRAEDTDWVRVRFGEILLAKSTDQVRESYLRISSLEDGYEQYLDMDSLGEWGNTSAYFNGDAVLVELMASPNASNQNNRVRVIGLEISDRVSDRSICFGVDDRVLSFDARDARLMPQGCSAWLFGDQGSCFLTAGHCGAAAGQVVQFNVPLSSSGGGTRNPPPQDQYVLDGSSVQTTDSVFIGNDWTVFGVFDNSTTGMSPLQAQGVSHTLASSVPPNDGRPIRITGYGTVSSPVPATWNQVQKTHVGPLVTSTSTTVRYQTDTTGGNSGSSIVDDTNNTSIGIHTNGGCGGGGGSNSGTSIFNSGLQNALANPLGICAPRSIVASLLFEPSFVSPTGSSVATLVMDNLQGHTVQGTPTMFVDSGSGFVGTAMSDAGGDTYEGNFGASDCGTNLSYYFSVEDEEGTVISVPAGGASEAFTTVALDDLIVVAEDDFEFVGGWSTFANASSGNWARTVPADHGLGDPGEDADGSGKCYVTSNNNGVDVDGGSVTLLSPLLDVSAVDSAVFRASIWMVGSADDSMSVEFTSNAGITWTVVETFENTNGWQEVSYVIADFVNPSAIFRARIVVSDGGADSLVEGGFDAFQIASEVCDDSACPADITGDGQLNFFDVSAFLSAFGAQDPIADFTGDGQFNFFDVSAFLSAFGAGCP